MKKIIILLVIFITIVFFTKFYDRNDAIEFGKTFKNLRYSIEKIIGNNEGKNNGEITNGKNTNKNNKKGIEGNDNINNDLIKYEDLNITYIDENGKIFTGIGTITLNYNGNNIAMLDRNLGATTNDTNSKDSYGYYFQRGNNYGFSLDTGDINTKKGQIDITGYGPSEYSSSYFIIPEYGERMIDHYTNGNNLWGGGLDAQENERGLTSNSDIKLRQGPCPEGYHIPSIGEWNMLFESWIEIYTGQGYKLECLFSDAKGYKMISFNEYCNESNFVNSFLTTFKIPLAGSLVYWNLYHNDSTNFWTSTHRRSFGVGKRYIYSNRHPTYADAMPIRCFANLNF